MSQHKMTLDNQPGAAFRADLNKALAALITNSAGATAPTTTYAYQLWADISAGALRMRNAANTAWIQVMQLGVDPILSNVGASATGETKPFQLWADTNSGLLKIRNQANTAWIEIGLLGAQNLGQLAPGMFAFSSSGIVEPGFLKANGAAVSRVAYANLFAKIGTRYGAGDGSTTFNLPEARGEFFRGWDDGRGVDAGRALGSFQAQDIQAHRHAIQAAWSAYSFFYGAGSSYEGWWSNSQTNTTATGGDETRPRNIAPLVLIKY